MGTFAIINAYTWTVIQQGVDVFMSPQTRIHTLEVTNLLRVEYTGLSYSHFRPPLHYEGAVCSISLQGLSRFIVLPGMVASGVVVECRLHFPALG